MKENRLLRTLSLTHGLERKVENGRGSLKRRLFPGNLLFPQMSANNFAHLEKRGWRKGHECYLYVSKLGRISDCLVDEWTPFELATLTLVAVTLALVIFWIINKGEII